MHCQRNLRSLKKRFFFPLWAIADVINQKSQMWLEDSLWSFFNYFLQFIWVSQWLMDCQFPPPAVSSPLPPKPHPTTLSSYLKCQRLLPITPPHTKTRSWGHANGGLLTETFYLFVFIFPLPLWVLLPCAFTVFSHSPRIIVFFL